MTTAEQLAERIHSSTDWYEFDPKSWCEPAAAELRRLSAENKALRADAERYHWLRENADCDENLAPMEHKVTDWGNGYWVPVQGPALDAAIDAAIEAAHGIGGKP